MKFWDAKGNEFTLVGGKKDGFILRGADGDKEIPINDLPLHRVWPPDVWEAMEGLYNALKSGDITVEELRKMAGKDT